MTDFPAISRQQPISWTGAFRGPLNVATKLDAQAQWEAMQTLPLIMTLLAGGIAAIMSQLTAGDSTYICIGGFGLSAMAALRLVFRSYRAVFIDALVSGGLTREQAEAQYQARYND